MKLYMTRFKIKKIIYFTIIMVMSSSLVAQAKDFGERCFLNDHKICFLEESERIYEHRDTTLYDDELSSALVKANLTAGRISEALDFVLRSDDPNDDLLTEIALAFASKGEVSKAADIISSQGKNRHRSMARLLSEYPESLTTKSINDIISGYEIGAPRLEAMLILVEAVYPIDKSLANSITQRAYSLYLEMDEAWKFYTVPLILALPVGVGWPIKKDVYLEELKLSSTSMIEKNTDGTDFAGLFALGILKQYLINSGEFNADELLELGVVDPESRELIELQIRSGDISGAIETLGRIESVKSRSSFFSQDDFAVGRYLIAQALINSGELERAFSFIPEALRPRIKTLVDLMEAASATDDSASFDRAYFLADNMNLVPQNDYVPPAGNVNPVLLLASAEFKFGFSSKATNRLRSAVDFINNEIDGWDRLDALYATSIQFAKLGMLVEADTIANLVDENQYRKNFALREIVYQYYGIGRHETALTRFREIDDDRVRILTLLDVASGM